MVAPCKDCAKRELGCHSRCDKYKEYEEERRQIRERRLLENEIREITKRKRSGKCLKNSK